MSLPSPQQQRQSDDASSANFPGFEPLDANYVYCPNQFLDLCLPNCSRGAVRIAGYLLRETLGWLDKNGQPLKQQIIVRYRDLIQKAGVSRGAIGPALAEAVQSGFIQCCQSAEHKSAGNAGQSAMYALHWNEAGDYATDLGRFVGFYTGEGHRTPVPNRFFDDVIRNESLSVVKVVGAVIRHTVGYQNQFGGRRSSSPLSYSQIQRYSNISDRSTLAHAIRHACDTGYIECVQSGCFSPNSADRQPAAYALRWLTKATNSDNGSKTRPASDRFKKPTSSGSEIRPENRYKNQTSKKDSSENNNSKQQTAADQKGIRLLTTAGLDEATAIQLLVKSGVTVIENQLCWLDARNPTENRLGMLRKAIDENWPPPAAVVARERREAERQKHRRQQARQQQEESQVAAVKMRRQKRIQRLLAEWGSASATQRQQWIQTAADREASIVIREIIRRDSPKSERPHTHVLDVIARDRNLPPVVQSSPEASDEHSGAEAAARKDSSMPQSTSAASPGNRMTFQRRTSGSREAVTKGVPFRGQSAGHSTGQVT
ncbi:MAG: hypothetical protein R3C59_10035 [Planctomycetaceae bacterium]